MSVPLFKDFRSETSSLLTGMYSGSGKWKVEGKTGSSKDEFVTLSPSVSNDGLILNAETRLKQVPVTLKASTSLEKKVKKLSASWKYDSHKFDLSLDPSRSPLSLSRFSASHSYADKIFAFSDAINRKYADFSIAMKATEHLVLGMSARLDLRKWIKESDEPLSSEKKSTSKHSKKVKISKDVPTASTPVSTSETDLQAAKTVPAKPDGRKLPYSPLDSLEYISFDFGGRLQRGHKVADILISDNFSMFSVGLKTSFNSERKISFGTELKYRVKEHLMMRKNSDVGALSSIVTLSAGISVACPLFSQNTIKARISEDRRLSLCYVWQQKGLTTSITLNDKGKFGAQFVVNGESFSSSPVTKHKAAKETKEPKEERKSKSKSSASPAKVVTL